MTEPYDPHARLPYGQTPPDNRPPGSASPYDQQWHGSGQRYEDYQWPDDDRWRQDHQRQDHQRQDEWRQDEWRQDEWRHDEWRREQWRQEQWRQEQARQEQARQEQWQQEQARQEQARQEQWRAGHDAGGPVGQPHWSGDDPYRSDLRSRRPDASRWHWLLLIPIVVPLITPLYNRVEPEWFGLPFFYWSQLSFALLASSVMVIVQLATKGRRRRGRVR